MNIAHKTASNITIILSVKTVALPPKSLSANKLSFAHQPSKPTELPTCLDLKTAMVVSLVCIQLWFGILGS